jgi:hypothetical protein
MNRHCSGWRKRLLDGLPSHPCLLAVIDSSRTSLDIALETALALSKAPNWQRTGNGLATPGDWGINTRQHRRIGQEYVRLRRAESSPATLNAYTVLNASTALLGHFDTGTCVTSKNTALKFCLSQSQERALLLLLFPHESTDHQSSDYSSLRTEALI